MFPLRRFAVIAAAAVVSTALTSTAVASASPGVSPHGKTVLTVAYDASGSSMIAKTKSAVTLGPTTLTTNLDNLGNFTGTLPLPSTSASFRALGLLPVTTTVSFIAAGPVKGALRANPLPMITSTATYYIQLSNVKVAGLPAFVGKSCRTAAPVTIPANTPAGQSFDVTSGGVVTGTYTIGNFANCGLTTGIINLLIPGPNNTATLTLSNGRIAG